MYLRNCKIRNIVSEEFHIWTFRHVFSSLQFGSDVSQSGSIYILFLWFESLVSARLCDYVSVVCFLDVFVTASQSAQIVESLAMCFGRVLGGDILWIAGSTFVNKALL